MRSPRLVWFGLLALAFAACGGDDDIDHGLKTDALSNTPRGEAIAIPYAYEDGETWIATLSVTTKLWQRTTLRGKVEESENAAEASVEVRTWIGAPDAEGVRHSRSELRYVGLARDGQPAEPPQGVTHAVFQHAPSGRPMPETREVTGDNVGEANALLGSLLLAGFGGAAPWVPDRAIQVGESWKAEKLIDPYAVRQLLRFNDLPGTEVPRPTFRGKIRLEGLRTVAGREVLDLVVDSLIELKGPLLQGKRRGEISLGDRVQGTASVDRRTGLPVVLDVKRTRRMESRSPGEHAEQRIIVRVRGEARPAVERAD